ncbi:hypothetical protein N9N67_03905 [Bacteriovoracaceae bacterium]|nr:hypothetical protein [Bacteriovoracaceae bacterium]
MKLKMTLLALSSTLLVSTTFSQAKYKKMKVKRATKKILKMIPLGTYKGTNKSLELDCTVEVKKKGSYLYINVDQTNADDTYGLSLYLPSSFSIDTKSKKNYFEVVDAEGTGDSANGPYEVIDTLVIEKISKKWSRTKEYRVTGSWETTIDRDDYVENLCEIVVKK